MDVWRSMIIAQGGDPGAALPTAHETEVITAERDGILQSLDALAVGEAAWRLGAGRARKEHAVQPGAGVVLHAKPGMRVRAGQALITLHTDTPECFARGREALTGAYAIGDTAPEGRPLILDRVD
jgi:thymidine phosphorylase